MTWSDAWEVEWGAGSDLNLITRAASRVFTRLRTIASESDEPSVQDVVEWIVEQLQFVEDTIHDIRWFSPLANAFGEQLDAHGRAVGQLRAGQTDDEYRITLLAIYSSISQRRTPVLMMAMLQLMVTSMGGTFEYREYYPAAFEVTLYDVSLAEAILVESVLRRAKLEGVRFTVHFVPDLAAAFRFDISGSGFDTAGIGFTTTLES